MKKHVALAALLLAVMMTAAGALADAAKELTKDCAIRDAARETVYGVTDGSYVSSWSAYGDKARMTVTAPEGETIHGVYIQFYNYACPFDVQVRDENKKWQTVASCDTDYLTGYVQLDAGAQEIRVRPKKNSDRLSVAEIHVFGAGDVPDWVQRWRPPHEKADLLLLSAHPDDELLFMGGAIPYYAGERGLTVQVAYLAPSTPYRKLELLDGLWLCGNTHYPNIGSFPDHFSASIRGMYQKDGWSERKVLEHVTWLYRRYRPEVVLTHDVNGEYGHGAHRVAADIAQKAVKTAADSKYKIWNYDQHPVWAIKKLYLHLYEEGALRMDWRVPLEAFGGKTAFDMAQAAFLCHVSQQDTEYRVEDFGPYDNAKFGLAYSSVGEDILKNDFFEHIVEQGE